jgi:hypothetical protein
VHNEPHKGSPKPDPPQVGFGDLSAVSRDFRSIETNYRQGNVFATRKRKRRQLERSWRQAVGVRSGVYRAERRA